MGLSKTILCAESYTPTKEDIERCDEAWRILCERGSVCVTNPSKIKEESIIDILKRNPHAFTGPFCDYHGDIPLSEYKRMIADE